MCEKFFLLHTSLSTTFIQTFLQETENEYFNIADADPDHIRVTYVVSKIKLLVNTPQV